jgi:hypothetical protein
MTGEVNMSLLYVCESMYSYIEQCCNIPVLPSFLIIFSIVLLHYNILGMQGNLLQIYV